MTAIGRWPPPLSWAERCSGHADAGCSRVGGRRRGLPHPGDGGSGGPAGRFGGQWARCRAAGLEFWSLSRHRGGVSTASSWCRRQHTLSRVDVGATTRPWMPSAVWWYWNAVNVSGRPMGVRVVTPTGPNPPSCARSSATTRPIEPMSLQPVDGRSFEDCGTVLNDVTSPDLAEQVDVLNEALDATRGVSPHRSRG